MAVSLADAACTVTGCPEGALRETVKVASTVAGRLPSVTVASVIASVGVASSSVIVPTPWGSAIVAFDPFERLTAKVSFTSSSVSPLTSTVTCFVVSPAAKFSVPLPAA